MSDDAHAAFLKMLEKISHPGTSMPSTQNEDFNADKLGERVSAVAKLVKIYMSNGVCDFMTLATRMAERHPEKFDTMKPYLSDVWNVAARAQNLKRISDVDADLIYDSIKNHVSENRTLQSDCLYELEDKVKFHKDRLEEWKRKHPQATRAKGMDKSLNSSIILAAIIIAVATILAAYISRPTGARFRNIDKYRILDTHTGKVHEVE